MNQIDHDSQEPADPAAGLETASQPGALETPSRAAALERERARLAAVVFTDVVGYSSRMQADETATIAAVQADFDRMRESCSEHGGEVLNTMGDGMMLCFSSAVEAVKFALEMQAEFGERNAAMRSGSGLQHRIGIHIGDVYRVQGGHMAGDGVNIAARLEPRAPKGGICVSQIVYDTVKGKVSMRADFMGPQTFKNIAEPIRIWRIAPEDTSKPVTAPAPLHVHAPQPASKGWLGKIVFIVIVLFAVDMLWTFKDSLLSPQALETLNARVAAAWAAVLAFVAALTK